MENLNKLQQTKVGDNINYFINGVNNNGVVVKMTGSYVTILKDGSYDIVNINDTFFVKDIIYEYKSWDDMDLAEKTELLTTHHAYSPRFLSKIWKDLPLELKDVLTKDALDNKKRIIPAEPKVEGQTTQGQATSARHPEHVGNNVPTPIGEKAPVDIKSKIPQRSTITTGDATFNPRNEKPDVPKTGKAPKDLSKAIEKLIKNTKGLVPIPDTKLEKAIKELRVATKGLGSSISKVEIADPKKNQKDKTTIVIDEAYKKRHAKSDESKKSDVENGAYGNVGSTPEAGISTQTNFDAEKDYEGQTHSDEKEQFKHEKQKPNTSKVNEKKKEGDGGSSGNSSTMTTSTDGTTNATYNYKDERKHAKKHD